MNFILNCIGQNNRPRLLLEHRLDTGDESAMAILVDEHGAGTPGLDACSDTLHVDSATP